MFRKLSLTLLSTLLLMLGVKPVVAGTIGALWRLYFRKFLA